MLKKLKVISILLFIMMLFNCGSKIKRFDVELKNIGKEKIIESYVQLGKIKIFFGVLDPNSAAIYTFIDHTLLKENITVFYQFISNELKMKELKLLENEIKNLQGVVKLKLKISENEVIAEFE
jgi:hypothetical protein